MRTIIQIAPEIGPGSGVAGVAYNLEKQWREQGVKTERFTLREARGDWLPPTGPGISGKLALFARVVWFSTVGTLLARRFLKDHPGCISICHNDALAGDIYVNHGLLQAAMRARGGHFWRMLRNPLHVFTAMRDAYRYRSTRVHQLVVNLGSADERLLRALHPRLGPDTLVIGNGVDVEGFRPPTEAQRDESRRHLGLGSDHFAVLFVGHEFDRKGLPLLLESMVGLPRAVHLVVVGGTTDMTARLRDEIAEKLIADRVHVIGEVSDPRPFFHACDAFALPSAYEAFPLVMLEALACGLPVVATDTGCAADVITNGVNGYVVPREALAVREAICAIVGTSRAAMTEAARASAERHGWDTVALEYLAAIRERLPDLDENRAKP